jgi:hypothetical protein
VSEWLDLMLEEVNRKKREAKEAQDEFARRAADKKKSVQHESESAVK